MKANFNKILIGLAFLLLVLNACKKDINQPAGQGSQISSSSHLKTSATTTTITKEAEQGTLTNGATVGSDPSCSGGAYVALQAGNLSISVTIPADQMYDVYITASSPSGAKTNTVAVDSMSTSFTLQQSATYQDYKVMGYVALRAGTHTIQILANWGYINIDRIKLVSTSGRTYSIKTTLSNSGSTTATKQLYSWMTQQFRSKIITGQTDGTEFTYIKNLTGKTPVVRGYDMGPYSPMYAYLWSNQCNCETFGPDPNATIAEDAINWYNNNAQKPIIEFQWHWFSPMGGTAGTNTFDTQYTTFDVSQAVIQGTPEYTATIRDIDAIAVQLKKLRDAGVPVLWRPLHESGGTWFWWSAKGSAPYKALWNMMYDRLTNYHKLNNLIWVWNGDDANWYVGNTKCDIVSIDNYGSPYSYPIAADEYNKIYTITAGTKILAMSEDGSMPNIDNAFFQGVTWSYFMTWHEHLTTDNTDAMIQSIYTNPKVITLENR